MSLFRAEIYKMFSRWRTYISFAVIALIVILTEVVMKLSAQEVLARMMRAFQNDFLIFGNLLNGWFVSAFIMNSLHVHIPFLITLVAGDMISGEATAGTVRLLLIRPASRARLVAAKYEAALFYTAGLVLFFGIFSVLLGLTLFGSGDLIMHHYGKFDVVLIPEPAIPVRMLLAVMAAVWGMTIVASVAFLFSALAENSIGPIIGTMAVVIVFLVLGNLPVDFFRNIKPFLFTAHMNLWQRFFEIPIPWGEIGRSGLILGLHNLGLFLAALIMFQRKDIKS